MFLPKYICCFFPMQCLEKRVEYMELRKWTCYKLKDFCRNGISLTHIVINHLCSTAQAPFYLLMIPTSGGQTYIAGFSLTAGFTFIFTLLFGTCF